METGNNNSNSAISTFDTLLTKNVPHILEKIFLSLDYNNLVTCLKVSKCWRKLLSTPKYRKELLAKKNMVMKFYKASYEGDAEEVRKLIYDRMVDVNLNIGPGLSTSLILSAKFGSDDVVEVLLKAGADIERGDFWGHTPLYWAVYNDNFRTVKLLLDAGAAVDNKDSKGRTPLCYAKSRYVIKMLIDHGADPDGSPEEAIGFPIPSWAR